MICDQYCQQILNNNVFFFILYAPAFVHSSQSFATCDTNLLMMLFFEIPDNFENSLHFSNIHNYILIDNQLDESNVLLRFVYI